MLLLAPIGIACAASTTAAPPLDGAKLEAKLAADAAQAGVSLTGVTCPRDRVARVGERFSCAATLTAGGSLVYDVTVTSDTGAYTYALASGQSFDGNEAATQLTADIASATPALADAKVTCPATILTPGGRATFGCTLTANGTTAPLTVTLTPGRPLDWSFNT